VIRSRLSEIFVSQKFIMFSLSLMFIAGFLPAADRATPFITAVSTFGVMKAMDYYSSRRSPGKQDVS